MADAHRIVDDFFPRAAALREAFERHLALPSAQRQVWEIARDAGGGSFLRANPLRVLPQTMVAELVVAVQSWAALELGLARAGMPELRLYAGGAREAPSNDVGDGLWAWECGSPAPAPARVGRSSSPRRPRTGARRACSRSPGGRRRA